MVPSGIPDTSPLLLLLEDHPDIGRYVTRLLQKKYRVVLATEGAYGLRLAMDLLPDLVICDIMMPGMDGLQVCRALKEDIRTEHIPILILSAKAGVEDRIQGLGLEVDGYMAKPFHPEELVSRIDALIRIRSRLRNRYANGQPSDLLQHDPDPVHDSFLVRLHEYFSRHADNPDLTVEEISRHFHLSRMQLHRKVKELTGDSTSIYLRKFRLRSARQLLQDSRMTISEVAYRVGYNNPKHFSRQYDEMFGSRPSDRRS